MGCKRKLLIYCTTIVFMLLYQFVFSQTDEYFRKMDAIFDIPSYKVTTGILINRALNNDNIKTYNLQEEMDSVELCKPVDWLTLYYMLYAAHLNPNSFEYDINIYKEYPKRVYRNGTMPLGLIFYNYDKIRADAIEKKLIHVDTIKQVITDISENRTPLETDHCLAFSVLTDSIKAGSYEFVLPESLFVSNQSHYIEALYINFDDGQGFISLTPNNPISVHYNNIGNKKVTLQVVINDHNYYASSQIYVKESLTNRMEIDRVPCEVNKFERNNITAYYGIWYNNCDDCTQKKIRKPIIIASGFDPQDKNRIYDEDTYDEDKNIYLYNIANHKEQGEVKGFLDQLREYGYDIIIWRSADSEKSIIKNADNLIEFIKFINNRNTTDNELIMYGASMGGLVVRYALTKMEYKGEDHKTKLFVSMDSPQNGADVLLGFQYLGMFFKNLVGGTIGNQIDNALNCDAAKEMLLYHHTTSDINNNHKALCANARTAFLAELESKGNFPQKPLTMAISLGSGIATNQGFSAGQRLITKHSAPISAITIGYLTLDVILSLLGIPIPIGAILNSLNLEFYVNAVPNNTTAHIYAHKLSANICIPKIEFLSEYPFIRIGLDCEPTFLEQNVIVNNTAPIDNAPGSIGGYHNLKGLLPDFFTNPFVEEILLNLDVNPEYDCFIPSYSALGLNLSNVPHTHIKNYLNSQNGVTQLTPHFYKNENPNVSPFDYLYIENKNEFHIYDNDGKDVFTADMLLAVDKLISREYLYLKDKTINNGEKVDYEATKLIDVDGNFEVQSGGSLTMNSEKIVLKPGFSASIGSDVHLMNSVNWVCIINKSETQNPSIASNNSNYMDYTSYLNNNIADSFEENNVGNSKNIKIFPNPVTEILTIELPYLNEQTNISVYEISGKLRNEESYFDTQIINLNFSNYPPGMYIVKVNSNKITSIGKIIKL